MQIVVLAGSFQTGGVQETTWLRAADAYSRGAIVRRMVTSRLLSALAIAFLLTNCASMSARSGEPGSLEDHIKTLERERQEAFVRGDIEFLDRQTAESYTTINAAGSLSTKSQFMQNLRAGTTKVKSFELSQMNARVFGNVAVLDGIYRDFSTVSGHDRRVNVRFTRISVNDGGTWRAVAYQQTPLPPER
jgi:hypothetical protein